MLTIDSVLKNNLCTGCGLCANSPDEMKLLNDGYLRPIHPVIDVISSAHCPGAKVENFNFSSSYDPLWGPIHSSSAGYAIDSEVRYKGSSGGVISALLQFLLDSGRVDAVVQIGADPANPIGNLTFISNSSSEIYLNAGSRYAPSSPLAVIRSLLGNGMKYAFVGKPCDVAALRSLISADTQIGVQFPYLLSFMCAGVPSERGAKAILKKFGVGLGEVKSFSYRGGGWPGLTKAELLDGTARTMTYNEAWGQILNKHLQPRCKLCADGIGESADIVCADAWHAAEDGYPTFSEEEGRSLILSRTAVGASLLADAISSGKLSIEEFPINQIRGIQPYQANRRSSILARKAALSLAGRKSTSYKNMHLFRSAVIGGVMLSIRSFWGMLYRIAGRRI